MIVETLNHERFTKKLKNLLLVSAATILMWVVAYLLMQWEL
jgi:hypothetical protein